MKLVRLGAANPQFLVKLSKDGASIQTALQAGQPSNSLPMQATEIYAEIKLKELKDRQKAEEEAARKRKKRIRDQ